MYYYLAVAAGGAAGAVSRYWLTSAVSAINRSNFPLGTFLVNVTGSLLIGICFVVLAEKVHLEPTWRPIIIVGFLGAMTTFSSFSLEALLLIEQGHYNTALLYIASSVVVCLLGTYAGMQVARLLF